MAGSAGIIILRHVIYRKGKGKRLFSTGGKEFSFFKGTELFCGLAEFGASCSFLGCGKVHLYGFLSGNCAGIFYFYFYRCCFAVRRKIFCRQSKIRIGKAESKFIIDFGICRVKGFKIPVTQENIFAVFHGAIAEKGFCSRIIIQIFGIGIH